MPAYAISISTSLAPSERRENSCRTNGAPLLSAASPLTAVIFFLASLFVIGENYI